MGEKLEALEKTFTIREALEGEENILYDLIRELALYERKDLSKLLLREENLVKFRDLYKVEFAECEGQIVGYALYFITFSSNQGLPILYLDDLYVKDPFRRRGIGTALIKKLSQIALKKGCFRMDWMVFSWNKESIEFYKRIGATFIHDSQPVQLVKEAMRRL